MTPCHAPSTSYRDVVIDCENTKPELVSDARALDVSVRKRVIAKRVIAAVLLKVPETETIASLRLLA